MAKVTKNPPAPVVPPAEYVLTLSEKEAQAVYDWTNRSGGNQPVYGIFEALYAAGLRQSTRS